MSEFVTIAKLSELQPNVLKGMRSNGRYVAVVLAGDKVYAFDDTCPHAACSISPGEVQDGNIVVCECHGAWFDVRTGEVLGGPPGKPLPVFEVQVEGDDIAVLL